MGIVFLLLSSVREERSRQRFFEVKKKWVNSRFTLGR